MGRPKATPDYKPTARDRREVAHLSGLGLTQAEIASVLDIGETTLARHFRAEIRAGQAKADAKVLTSLFKAATDPACAQHVTAAIFWTKVRRRWHEVQRVIHGFDPSAVVEFVNQIIGAIKRMVPDTCPHCKTALDLKPGIATELRRLSDRMAAKLPESQIVPMAPGVAKGDPRASNTETTS